MVSVTTATGGIRAAAYPIAVASYARRAMAKTLLTGATGFIGRMLAASSWSAVTTCGSPFAGTGKRATTSTSTGADATSSTARSVRRAMKGVDRVFHAAGMTSVRPEDSERLFEVNVGGARIVLEECLRADVERAVHVERRGAGPAAGAGAPPTKPRSSRPAAWASRT